MAQYDVDLREYWRILKKRKFMVFLTVIILGVFSTVFSILRAPIPLYKSSCSIKFEKETTFEGLYAKSLSWSAADDIETQISVLNSYSVMKNVAERVGRIPKGMGSENLSLKGNLLNLIDELQSKVEVSRETYTNIINIHATDPDPVFAQKLANAIALTYKEFHSEEQHKRSKEALKYITHQLKQVRKKLRGAENAFNQFTQKNQLVSIDLQSENLLLREKEIKDEIRKFLEAKSELGVLLKKLENFIIKASGSGEEFFSEHANRQYKDANDKLVEFVLKRDSLLEDFTEKHPEVIAIQRKIIEKARKMAIVLQLQIKSIISRKKEFDKELVTVNEKTSQLMEKKLEYDRLKREVESYNDMVVLLEGKNQEALIRKAEKPEEVTIVKPALLPTSPINPPKKAATGVMGVAIGIILGMVLAFIAETFDTSLGAIEDVEETLGTQVLAVIPHADLRDIQGSIKEQEKKGPGASLKRRMQLVSHFVPQSILAESFRTLRTNIQFRDLEKNIKTLSITSASPQEGKTLVACNLAITMAQAGLKTLLVEADLRKPMVSKAFGVELSPGLTDVLLGNYAWRDVLKTITDIIIGKMDVDEVMMTPGLDNLHLVTSGSIPPNPAELIDSKRLIDFIEETKQEFDIIIFDTPPILSTADAAILGTKLDATVLVYRVGSISKRLLKRATVQLEQVKSNILGVVLNGMKAEVSPDFQDFKYYKYYYSHGEKGKSDRKGKGFFHFFSSKKTESPPSQDIDSYQSEGKPYEKKPSKRKLGSLRVFLILIALCFLTVGLLWQNGLLPIEQFFIKKQPSPKKREFLARKRVAVRPIKKSKLVSPSIEGAKKMGPSESKSIKSTKIIKSPEKISIPKKTPKKNEPQKLKSIPTKAGPASSIKSSKKIKKPQKTVPKTYPYSLRVGSYKTLKAAEEAISSLNKKGLSGYWTEVDLGQKGKWYRVFVGFFSTKDEALTFKNKHGIKADRILTTSYAVQIDASSSLKKLNKIISDLEAKSYSPYFIESPPGYYRLLVGAFIRKKRAEELAHRLKAYAKDCQVVLR